MVAFLISYFLVVILEPRFIKYMKSIGVKGQPIRDDGPKDHINKSGTPTMGGTVIIFSVVVSTLICADLTNPYIWLGIFVLLSFAWIGFIDDWKKVTKQNTKGISGKQKLLYQGLFSLVVAGALTYLDFGFDLTFPFFKNFTINLGYFFIPFVIVVMVGSSNAVNLTDGLDGLAIGCVISVAFLYALLAYLTGNKNISDYLNIMHISGAGELSILLCSVIAGGLGFLWFNAYPAQVFMGDVGALSLGATLGYVAVVVKHEILLVLAGGIFVIEALSVIIQTYSFKLTGKRVFKMAPIHHHFELLGWHESKVIIRFWIISILLVLISLTTLKLR